MKFKRLELALFGLLAVLSVYAAGVSCAQTRLADGLVRLHVIAHSDSAADQALKLRVRDRVLDTAAPLLADAHSQAEVRRTLAAHLQELVDAAADELRQAQAPYTVTAQLTGEYYPTRRYDTFSLPAGEYVGLKLRLGRAEGRNWWCVVFPPLCTDAAAAPQDALCDQTTFRFRTAELLGALRARLRG